MARRKSASSYYAENNRLQEAQRQLDETRKNGIQSKKEHLDWGWNGQTGKEGAYKAPSTPKVQQPYYSRASLDTGMETAMKDIQALETDMNQKKRNWDMMMSMTGGREDAYTAGSKKAYEDSKKAYDAAIPSLLDLQEEYEKEVAKWKTTIRGEDQIRQDLDDVKKQIKEQRRRDAFGAISDVYAGSQAQQQESAEMQKLLEKQAMLNDELGWRQYYSFNDIANRKDFEQKSKPVKQAETTEEGLRYNIVNGIADVVENPDGTILDPNEGGVYTGSIFKGPARTKQMKQEEVKIYNYLFATEGAEKANAYLDYIQSDLNARNREQVEKAWEALAESNPALASLRSVGLSPLKGAAYIGQSVDMFDDGKIDQNDWYNELNLGDKAAIAEVNEAVEEKWGPTGSFVYNLGMSMGNFLMNTGITGGNQALTLAIMGTGAAADTVIDAKDRGLSDGQAYAIGTIAGAAEIITEKVSLEALLNPELLADGTMKYILKNMIAEGSEEAGSDIINLLADVLIAGDQSEFQQTVAQYEKTGEDPKEAFGHAVGDQLLTMGLDALSGAISGGLMSSGGAIAVNRDLKQTGYRASWDWDYQQRQQRTGEMLEAGLAIEDETLNKITLKLQQKVADGKQLSARDIGQLHTALNQAVTKVMEEEQKKQQPARKTFQEVIMEQIAPKRAEEASMRDTQKAATETVTTEEGLQVSKDLADQAQRLSKDTGRTITIIDETGEGGMIQNGHYEKGRIYVNAKSANPMGQIVGHELTHSIEGTESYDEVAKMVADQLGDQMDAKRQELQDRYARAGVELTDPADVDHEVVAEWVEQHLLSSEQEIHEMVQQKPTLGQKILTAIDNMLAKLGNASAKERAYLRKIRGTYAKALRESQRSQKKAAPKTASAQTLEVDEQTPAAEPGQDLTPEQQKTKTEIQDTREQFAAMMEAGEITEEEYDQMMDALDQQEEERGLKTQYSISAEKEDSDGRELSPQQQEYFKDSKVRTEDGKLRVLYHGTNNGEFNTFDKEMTGNSNDAGFFGDGFYFAFTKGEARFYGGRVIEAYLDLKNPFRYIESLYGKGPEKNSHHLAFYENLPKFAPELANDLTIDVIKAGEDEFETVTASQVVRDVKEIAESPDLVFEEIRDDYEPTGKTFAYRYKGQTVIKTVNNTDTPESRYDAAIEVLTNDWWDPDTENDIPAKYEEIDIDNPTKFVVEHAKEFTEELKRQGYDGVLQSDDGDEAVAFEPEQIKRTDNKNPTSDQDIRYSIGWDPDGSVAASTPDGSRYNRDELIGRLNFAQQRGNLDQEKVQQEIDKIKDLTDDELQYYMLPDAARQIVAEDDKEEWKNFQKAANAKAEKKAADIAAAQAQEEATAAQPVLRDKMTRKAQQVLQREENQLKKDILKSMGLDKFGDPEAVTDLVHEISDEYLQTGTISEEKMDLFFDKAYSEGIVLDNQFFEQYKPVKDYIRTTAVTLADQDKADIADFKDWRAQTFGRMRIVNQGGLPVDVAYDELHDMAPELFPESITHPADQLTRMYDVADSIRVTEKNLEDFAGDDAETMREWARNDFDEMILKHLPQIRAARRVAQEKITAENTQKALLPKTTEEAAALMEKAKKAKRGKERVSARNLLTARDQQQVGRLLAGDILPEDLDYKKDNVKGIMEVYQATKEYEDLAKQVRAWRADVHKKMRDTADSLLENSINWKDKKSGIAYARETMRRNIYDIVPDKAEADAILQEYFEPVQVQEAKATRFKTEYRDRVKALDLSRKVAEGNTVSEAHAVQLYGEAMDNIEYLKTTKGRVQERDGKTLDDWEGIVEDLWAENPNLDQGKIENAVKEFRQIYEELFQAMNRVRVENGYEPINHRRGYFPHFQAEEEESLTAAFGRALGINTSVDILPTAINGLTHTFKPGITWFGHAQERQGFDTAYDAVQGFDKYIEGVASVVYQTENIQKLRALANQIRYRSSPDGIKDQVDAINADPNMTEEMKKLAIQDVYKEGKYTLSNFVNELEEYTNLLANKKSKLDRTVESLMGRRIYSFMKAWESRIGANMIAANVSSAMTNFIPLTQAWSRMSSKDLLQGMWGALSNMNQRDGLMGMSDFYTNRMGSNPLVQTKVQQISSALGTPMELIDSFVTESIVRGAYNMYLQKGMSEAEAMHQADLFAAGVMADRSKGSMPTLFESRNPLIKAFTQFQLEVNNQFSEMYKDLPRYGREEGLKKLAAALAKYFFGAWLYNQLFEKFFGRKPAVDPFSMLNDVSGDLTGYHMPNVLDLAMGKGDFKTEKKKPGEVLGNLATNVAGALPFSAAGALVGLPVEGGRLPAAAAVPNFKALGEVLDKGVDPKKRWDVAKKELGKLMYIAPPFAGGQMLKTYKGLSAYFKGGSYTVDKEGNDILQYPIYKDDPAAAAINLLTAGVMGKNATSEAQKWAQSGFKSLSPKGTALYQDITAGGMKDKDAYKFVKDLASIEKTEEKSQAAAQREFLENAEVPGYAKAAGYYGILASDKERELMDQMDGMEADPAVVADTLMQIKDQENTGEGKANRERDLILNSGLKSQQRQAMFYGLKASDKDRGIMDEMAAVGADDGSIGDILMKIDNAENAPKGKTNIKRKILMDSSLTEQEKLYLYRNKLLTEPTSKDADIDAFRQVGLDFDEFLEAQNEYSRLNSEIEDKKERALEWSRWIEKHGYTDKQKAVARESFVYFGMTPVKPYRYEKLLNNGIDEATAYDIAEKINAIKTEGPEGSYEKYDVVLNSGLSRKDQMKAMKAVMQESSYKYLEIADNLGVDPKTYLNFRRELFRRFDKDGNGKINKEECIAAIDSMDGGIMAALGYGRLSNREKAILLQLTATTSSPRRNKWDPRAAQEVDDILEKKKAEEKKEKKKEAAPGPNLGKSFSEILFEGSWKKP